MSKINIDGFSSPVVWCASV